MKYATFRYDTVQVETGLTVDLLLSIEVGCFSSSFMNLIFSVVLFKECKMSSVLSFLTAARTSSTYLCQVLISLLL